MRNLLLACIALALFSCQNNVEDQLPDDGPLVPESVSLRTDTLSRSYSCTNDSGTCVDIELISIRLEPEGKITRAISSHWNDISLDLASYSDMDFRTPEALADSMIAEYQRVYKTEEKPPMPWELTQQVDLLYNARGLVSLGLNQYSYTGGAHGSSYYQYALYELSSGSLIQLDSLIAEPKRDLFINAARTKFLNKYLPDSLENLQNAGFWMKEDSFRLPQNFAYDGKNMELIYNAYEVAPYTEGTLRISFSKSELDSLLNPRYR